MNKEELIRFEQWCVESYHNKMIRSPIHLSGGNEDILIELFKNIKQNDWLFTTYRSHYHVLLKGVDSDWLKQWILDNRSIQVMNKEHHIVSSAIVGGTLPQAIGVALGIKLQNETNKVWCFLGDMTASLGVFHEAAHYAYYNNLPIHFIIEDNGVSTDTPTEQAWGGITPVISLPNITRYSYKRVWPHYGTGQKINFDVESKT